jgi:hypothetical protein
LEALAEMSTRFHDRTAQPVRGTGEQWDGGELYVPAE